MHRPLILGLLFSLFSLLAGAANAACPGNPTSCGNPMQAQTSGSVMYAAAYGVTGDGSGSDDVALKAAVDACAAVGGHLFLPPGRISLTGTATINLRDCHLEGVGVPLGRNNDTPGTTILITSRTVNPFTCGFNWGITGVNFYWPNQTDGVTSYMPLISGNACGHAYLDHVVIVNAYDGISGPGNWGDLIISNSTMYAVHDMFAFAATGDSFAFTNMRFTPGPWADMVPGLASVLNEVDKHNTLFHILPGGGVTVTVSNSETEAWRWGIRIDSGGLVAASLFDLMWDGTGTLIDTSPGGTYAIQNEFRGSNSLCASVRWDSSPLTSGLTYPCFILNASSGLVLRGFLSGANKEFITTSGGSLYLDDISVSGVASIADGSDHALINVTGGNPEIYVRNSRFSGSTLTGGAPDPHARGILTNGHAPTRLVVQNNWFIYFNEAINADVSPGTTLITGNSSAGEAAASAITLTGSGGVVHSGNQWGKPPMPTATGGTVQPGSLVSSGYIGVSATVPTTSGTLTLPWGALGAAGWACQFWTNGGTNYIASSVSGNTWNWNSGGTDIHGAVLFYNCPGAG